jgi:tryptophan-rich sensory protein
MLAFSSKLFANIDPTAGYLLLPTLAWVTVASSLNFAIDRLNVD